MVGFILDAASGFASGIDFNQPVAQAANAGLSLIGNPSVIIIAIILIVVGIIIFFFLKHIIGHVIFGGIAWAIAVFVFNVNLPLIPSFIISIIFGPAGLGIMLILKFFGLLV